MRGQRDGKSHAGAALEEVLPGRISLFSRGLTDCPLEEQGLPAQIERSVVDRSRENSLSPGGLGSL